MQCRQCDKDFKPARVYSPTAPNRPRFCSAACRGRGYRAAKVRAIDQELAKVEAAIYRVRQALMGHVENKA
jgi:hypothetical protein